MSWSDEYPHELHANVLLLDNKIECWKTGNRKSDKEFWSFKSYWKPDRHKDYIVETKTWIVNNDQEHSEVFEFLATEWYRQWEHADDYKLGKAYG